MHVMDYFQSHAAGFGALIGVLSFLGVALWGIFKIAVQQATGPKFVAIDHRFDKVEQNQADIKTEVALVRQGQDSINQRLDRIESLLTRERV